MRVTYSNDTRYTNLFEVARDDIFGGVVGTEEVLENKQNTRKPFKSGLQSEQWFELLDRSM